MLFYYFLEDLMFFGVILSLDGLLGLGRFEKGILCSVCFKGNRYI